MFDFYSRSTMIRHARHCLTKNISNLPDSLIHEFFRNPIIIKNLLAKGLMHNLH